MSDQAQPDGQAQPGARAGLGAQAETRRRVTVQEAARILETTVEGVRSRIKRGSLDSMRVGGTVYVLLAPDQADRALPDDQAQPDPPGRPDDALQRLVDEQRDMIEWLQREIERKDTLLMSLMQRVPELEAPPEPREEPETASPAMEGVETPIAEEKPVSRWRSWVHRLFGGPGEL